MNLLFNENPEVDCNNVLAFLDNFVEEYDLKGLLFVDPYAVLQVAEDIARVPCKGGVEAASVFKKAATFVLCFVNARPIKKPLPRSVFPDDLIKIKNHQNGVLALLMVFKGMRGAQIHRSDGETVVLENPIEVSSHSFVDLVNAVSEAGFTDESFMMLTLLLEQLAYKTNPDCQYPVTSL